jgi:hypothetical protein
MENKIYDNYAAAALQALIAKTPMLDTKGEIGKTVSAEELNEIKKELCRSAHSYAAWMIQTREEFATHLKQNGFEWIQEK